MTGGDNADSGLTGEGAFTYSANEAVGDSNPAAVTVTVY